MMYFVTWLYVQLQNLFLIRSDQMDAFIVSNGIISKPLGHLVGTTWLRIWLGKKNLDFDSLVLPKPGTLGRLIAWMALVRA